LLNGTVGVERVLARFRPDPNRAAPATRTHRRSIHAVKVLQARLRAPRATSITTLLAQALRPAISPDRAAPVAVAGILALAAFLAYLPASPSGPVGGPEGDGAAPRIVIGGFGEGWEQEPSPGSTDQDYAAVAGRAVAPGPIDGEFVPVEIPDSSPLALTGPFLDDGTLLAGVAPDTTVPDGSGLMRSYRVKAGDTLVGVARQFNVSMMTVWWANKIGSKDALKVGQTLLIPPISGLVVSVTDTDTLESLAAKHKVTTQSILDANELDQPVLVVGQQLMIPGAVGDAIPTPKPTPKPTIRPRTTTSSGGTVRTPTNYTGGAFAWPVVGGGNYISQYFRYGHYGLDIAADHGSRVRAASSGTVTFAGWKSNGGGYQVWIAHGGGLYTTYNHMSGVSVGRGQQVAKGQQVGRIGCTGYCTGPHLHFEVWRGPIWDGGSRINPLRYY
jgi:murein DD-endopeptidase MepM/ murein hydrolase activator NlpD